MVNKALCTCTSTSCNTSLTYGNLYILGERDVQPRANTRNISHISQWSLTRPFRTPRSAIGSLENDMAPNDGPHLIHPILQDIPKGFRFLVCGGVSNILFLISLNHITALFQHQYTPSVIYSVFSLAWIPVGHALTCALVFGWPKPYLTSLIGTSPIGLACAAIGTFLTGFLEKVQFDRAVKSYLELLPFLMPMKKSDEVEEDPGTYSSIVVLIVTGIFAYVASDYLMGSSTTKKKEE